MSTKQKKEMQMEYHLFRRDVKTQNKIKKVWYYWYTDLITQKRVQKVCKDCTTKYQAEIFISKLPPLKNLVEKKTINELTKEMYINGSKHLERCNQTGHIMTENTLIENRRYLKIIQQNFGKLSLEDITVAQITNFLIDQPYKSSWKNHFLAVLSEIYVEANYQGYPVTKPTFTKFHSVPKKADILTDEEIEILFKEENFVSQKIYLLFLLELSAGLRLSEARAFRPCQMLGNGLVLVNGFLDKNTQERNDYNKSGSEDNPKWRIAIIPKSTETLIFDFIQKQKIPPANLMFTNNNKPLRVEYLRKKFLRAVYNSGIKIENRKISSHSLRYTYVTKMRSVYDGDVVRQMVGHTTLAMTDYYTRNSIEDSMKKLLPVANEVNEIFQK